MHRKKKYLSRLQKGEGLPLPASLEEAFAEIEQLDSHHPDSRGTTYAGIRVAETRDVAPRTHPDYWRVSA